MPEKEGDDDKKSTKSVVNKRQKQMMGEEGYDIARDMGKVKPSKDKKDATTMPPSKEMKKTQKVNKGPSAFERVKAKYGKSVMNVGKKKANEELDLSKVAEAFGGYIVEANGKKNGKKQPPRNDPREPFGDDDMGNPSDGRIDDFIKADDPFNVPDNVRARRDAIKQGAGGTTGTRQNRKKSAPKPGTQKLGDTTVGGEVKTTIDPSVIDPKFAKKSPPKPPTPAEIADQRKAAQAFKKDIGGEKIVSATMQDKLEKTTAKPKKARKRRSDAKPLEQIKKEIDAKNPTKPGEFTGKPVPLKQKPDDYEERLDRAYEKSLEGARKGQIPAGSPLPQATGKKGVPQKPQPDPEPPVSGAFSGRGVGRVDRVGGSKPVETGKRAADTRDPRALRSALTGVKPDGTYMSRDERIKAFQQSRVGKETTSNLTKGALKTRPSELEAGGGFDTGRSGESITRRPSQSDASPNITVNVNQPKRDIDIKKTAGQIGRKFSDVATDAARSQSQSMMGAMGGMIGKAAFPDVAGAEAGVNLARGDKLGAALSLGQSLGGSLGFAAGVANAIRMRMPNYKVPKPVTPKFDPRSGGKLAKQGQVSMDTATGEREAKMSVGGMALGRVLRNVKNAAKQNARRATTVRGGRAIQVSAGK